MHSMDGFAPERIQSKDINRVARMNNHLAVGKDMADSLKKILGDVGQMGVRENACLDHETHEVEMFGEKKGWPGRSRPATV